MKRFFIFAFCALASVPALPGDWVESGTSSDLKRACFFEVSSMEKNGSVRGAWFNSVLNDKTLPIDFTLAWMEFNCKTKKYRFTDAFEYDFYGNSAYQSSTPTKWMRATPGSIAEATINKGCSKNAEIIFTNKTPGEVASIVREVMTAAGYWK